MGDLMEFWGISDDAKHPQCIINRDAPHKKVLGEKYDWARKSPKTIKIEGYNSRF